MKDFRIAVSGFGKRSHKVLSYLREAMPEMRIVALADPDPSRLADFCDPSEVAIYDDTDKMLANSSADLLFVGSPNHLHISQIRSGLEAGLQVFSEKPVVTTLDDTWKLAKLLAEHGAHRVMVGLVLRYSEQMGDLRHAIATGHLGRIVSLEANEHIEPQHGGFFMRDWRRKSEWSGGYMLEKCCHDLDIYSWLLKSRPLRVASFGGRGTFLSENRPIEADHRSLYHQTQSHWQSADDPFETDADIIDHQTAILTYENGVSMSFHTNLNAPDESRHFCLIGTEGMAEGDFQRGYLHVTDARSKQRLVDRDYTGDPNALVDHYGADRKMADELARFFRGQLSVLPVSIVDALEAGVAAMAIEEARRRGTVVDLQPYWDQLDKFDLRAVSSGRMSVS
ncbi:Gfo/Idh/MocA family protein [Aliiroseovarius sp. 2305UL8-7]|uniref:Gfo/Idh/MocA family protein n=1 Tax=Aliiroseovarius conchicola TaxID=3121637 RepID=UPI00352903CD